MLLKKKPYFKYANKYKVNVHYHANTQESYINFSQSKLQSKESYMW